MSELLKETFNSLCKHNYSRGMGIQTELLPEGGGLYTSKSKVKTNIFSNIFCRQVECCRFLPFITFCFICIIVHNLPIQICVDANKPSK